MPIPCEKCDQPVHEQVVICPHCGEPTGVAMDPVALAEIEIMDELEPDREAPPLPLMLKQSKLTRDETGPHEPPTDLPRAIARRRRS